MVQLVLWALAIRFRISFKARIRSLKAVPVSSLCMFSGKFLRRDAPFSQHIIIIIIKNVPISDLSDAVTRTMEGHFTES